MKIALLCPSNMLYMPYVKNYEKVLVDKNVNYDIFNWDRFQMEEVKKTTFRDKKKGHQRNFIDYLKYRKFLMHRLDSSHYDKIIVFGIQLSYFLNKILRKKYKGNYIIDIRDHNKILNFMDFKELIECSDFTVLSSPGYTEWLPESKKYLINHNTQISSINELKEISAFNKEEICISNIGALNELQINTTFINSLKNNPKFKLNYHGEGDINNDIISYLKTNEISNAFVTGRYNKEDEEKLYENSDLINVLRTNGGINNKTALPNRLYNAVIYGKPLLSLEGSYLTDVVSKYHLGIVISSFKDTEQKIIDYFKQVDLEMFNKGREKLFIKVLDDNALFNKKLSEFLSSYQIRGNVYGEKTKSYNS